jgi:hypothetical protein
VLVPRHSRSCFLWSAAPARRCSVPKLLAHHSLACRRIGSLSPSAMVARLSPQALAGSYNTRAIAKGIVQVSSNYAFKRTAGRGHRVS